MDKGMKSEVRVGTLLSKVQTLEASNVLTKVIAYPNISNTCQLGDRIKLCVFNKTLKLG